MPARSGQRVLVLLLALSLCPLASARGGGAPEPAARTPGLSTTRAASAPETTADAIVLPSNAAPLSLVLADLDGDQALELVAGYAADGDDAGDTVGLIAIWHGDRAAQRPGFEELAAHHPGQPAPQPFRGAPRIHRLEGSPAILLAGDFDGDGRGDLAYTAPGAHRLVVLPDPLRGPLGRREIELPGRLTGAVAGEMNRRDGLPELVVAVETAEAARLLVYEGWDGALGAAPEAIDLPAPPTQLLLGDLDRDHLRDLALVIDERLHLIRGRDRRLDPASEQARAAVPAPSLIEVDVASRARAIELGLSGQRSDDPYRELRVETPAGWGVLRRDETAGHWTLDPLGAASSARAGAPRPAIAAGSRVIAEARARLDGDGVEDLVVVLGDRVEPLLRLSAAGGGGLAVNSTGDQPDGQVGDGTCDTGNATIGFTGLCTLRAAIQEHNTGAFGRSILVGGSATMPIQPQSGLPAITVPVDLSGGLIDGSQCFNCPVGLLLANAGGSTVTGMVIQSFSVAIQVNNGDDNLISSNRFGTDPGGSMAVGPTTQIILTNSSDNVIFDNVVAGPAVMLFAGSHTNTFLGNFFGVSPTSGADLGVGGINASSGGGNLSVVIDNVIASGGVELQGGGGAGSRVEDNFVGTDAAGSSIVGNSDFGIRLVTVPGATVRDNLVVGQTAAGIAVSGDDAVVVANRVGVDMAGTSALPNNGGIVVNGARATVFDNTSSGNTGNGIDVLCSTGVCTIAGNRVGTDVTGSQPLGNGLYGIAFGSFSGRVEALENVVAANGSGGIRSGGGSAHVISGNLIGTDASGSAPLGNHGHGILLQSGASSVLNNQIADTRSVAGAQGHGLELQGFSASGNTIEGNVIGLAADGATPMGNQGHGIFFNSSASNNSVGASGGAKANLIAHNGMGGVVVGSGTGNTITGNPIFENGELGIDHGGDGPTANDAGDGDGGPNNRQNAPVIVDLGASKSISLQSHPNETFRIEVFQNEECDPSGFGEALTFLGFADLTTDGAGSGAIVFPTGARVVAATATRDSTGDTSELSACAARPASIVNSQRDGSDNAPGNGACDTGSTVTILGQQKPECTLRAAIQEANAAAGDDVILFDPNGPGEPGAAQDGVYVIQPGSALPVVTGTTRIGGAPGSQQVDVDGLLAGGSSGLSFANDAARSQVRDLAIYRFSGQGIDVDRAPGFRLISSFLGIDRAGSSGRGNGLNGIRFRSVQGAEVGGPTPAEGNVISGNHESGVLAVTSREVVVHGGNRIGTTPDGKSRRANGGDGIRFSATNSSRIGSPGPGEPRNIIGGNGDAGITLSGSNNNLIVRNDVGEDPSTSDGAPNDARGVVIGGGSRSNNLLRNRILGNSQGGVVLVGGNTDRNVVSTNEIRNNNSGDAILLFDGAHDNRIAFNRVFSNGGGDGIRLQGAGTVRNELTGNEIGGHAAGLGIDLAGDGVTANDAGDGDVGPNHRQNFPVIGDYSAAGVATGSLNGPPGVTYRIELYLNQACDPSGNGEAERLVAATSGTTDVTGNLEWRAVPGVDPLRPFLTALAIHQPGTGGTAFELDTSELSPCVEIDPPPGAVPTLLINEVDADTGAIPRELVELLFRGAGVASLTGRVVVFFDGDTDTAYAAFDLDGEFSDAQGRFVLGNADTPGVDLVFDDFLLQDGPDAVALYQANAADFPVGAPVTTTNLIDAVVYGSGAPDPELLTLLAPDQPQVDEAAGGRPTLHSMQRCPDGAGDERATETYAPAPPTPDDENRCLRCQLTAFDSLLAPDPMILGLVRENLATPVPNATVYFEVVDGPSTGETGASATDAMGSVDFEYERPAGACGADLVEASGMFDGLPFVCRVTACAWCPADADLVLLANPAPGAALFQACSSITARDAFTVGAGDEVTFRSPSVRLGSGFRVLAGGSFVADTGNVP